MNNAPDLCASLRIESLFVLTMEKEEKESYYYTINNSQLIINHRPGL